jgi:N-acetylglucosaminyldiphosphoundecaprenol N-acetyl-beta-D-mannosaminyltransferase
MQNHKLAHVRITGGRKQDLLDDIAEGIQDGRKQYCMPLNLTKYVMSQTDQKLRDTVAAADYVIADGVPIVWLSRRAKLKDVCRITGVDLAESILCDAAKKQWKLFFLGASPDNLRAATQRLAERFSGLNIVGAQDGYFQPSDVPTILDRINSCRPDVLLLGLGLPQKEYFVHDHLARLDVRLCLPVGGAFDIWAGAKQRTPALLQTMGFEWLYRSLYDLSRAKLILKYGARFAKDFVLYPRKG